MGKKYAICLTFYLSDFLSFVPLIFQKWSLFAASSVAKLEGCPGL